MQHFDLLERALRCKCGRMIYVSLSRLLRDIVQRETASLVQSADIGWPTGNGEKLSFTQAQLGQAACLAVA